MLSLPRAALDVTLAPALPGVVTTQRFKMPGNGQAQFPSPTSAKAVPTYYSFNYGPVHLLNYNMEIPYDVGTPQWLCASLHARPMTCKDFDT